MKTENSKTKLFLWLTAVTVVTSCTTPYHGKDRHVNERPILQQYDDAPIETLKDAAEHGVLAAQFELANRYDSGKLGGSRESREKLAMKWYRKAHKRGHTRASKLYASGLMFDRYYRRAEAVLDEASVNHSDDPETLYDFASEYYSLILFRGIIKPRKTLTEYDIHRLAKKAIAYHGKAFSLGHQKSAGELGRIYSNRYHGHYDCEKAINYIKLSPNPGYSKEIDKTLAEIYLDTDSKCQDLQKGLAIVKKHSRQGDYWAVTKLADCYSLGVGVRKDRNKAIQILLDLARTQIQLEEKKNAASWSIMRIGGIYDSMGDAQNAYAYFNAAYELEPFDRGGNAWRELEEKLDSIQLLAAENKSRKILEYLKEESAPGFSRPDNSISTGTGFFVTTDGYFLTAWHVVKDAQTIRIRHGDSVTDARLVRGDPINDIALCKVEGSFSRLLVSSNTGSIGQNVFTVGIPNPAMQGQELKYSDGTISSLTGTSDDPRMYQISIPLQPGNSGGALLDEQGNVIGLILARLNDSVALEVSAALP